MKQERISASTGKESSVSVSLVVNGNRNAGADDANGSFTLIRGSDPRVATCRGKLQNKRSKLNQEINKELRLRAGAENLFKATTNRKLRETVALELSFVNSNLQLLKEQLAELNSSVELYQNDSLEPVMPMIPLGLKETKEIDFREPFKDFILEHYSEDGEAYEDSIAELMDIRQAMRTPLRDGSGVALLFQYYNQLYFVERRFFPPDRSLGIYFEWYDSLTGVPSCQRTVAFERACVLFNAAAVYTQIGARQDRGRPRGLDRAADAFLRAAGLFSYIRDNFTNAPSMDLGPDMLDMLLMLMLAQARECLVEKLSLQEVGQEPGANARLHLEIAQECARLRHDYAALVELVNSEAVKPYVPYSWVALVCVKVQHYSALAHFRAGQGLTILAEEAEEAMAEATATTKSTTTSMGEGKIKAPAPPPPSTTTTGSHSSSSTTSSSKNGLRNYTSQAIRHATSLGSLNALSGLGKEKSTNMNGKQNGKTSRKPPAPIAPKPSSGSLSSTASLATTASGGVGGVCHTIIATLYSDEDAISENQFKDIGRAHLKEALLSHEEAQRLHRMSRELRGKAALASVLKRCHAQALDAYAATETEDDFQELINPPLVTPSTKFQLSLTSPDFSRHRVEDLFRGLGPVAIFSAKHHWTAPRTVTLRSPHNNNNNITSSTNNINENNASNGGGSNNNNNNNAGLGFSVRGDGPVVVAAVESTSLADLGGVKEGDLIVSIGSRDVKWSTHEEVVTLIRQAGSSLTMRLVTPMDNTNGKPSAKCGVVTKGSVSGGSSHSSSGVSSGEPSPAGSLSHHKRLTWNPFRRSATSNNSSASSAGVVHATAAASGNVILR